MSKHKRPSEKKERLAEARDPDELVEGSLPAGPSPADDQAARQRARDRSSADD